MSRIMNVAKILYKYNVMFNLQVFDKWEQMWFNLGGVPITQRDIQLLMSLGMFIDTEAILSQNKNQCSIIERIVEN